MRGQLEQTPVSIVELEHRLERGREGVCRLKLLVDLGAEGPARDVPVGPVVVPLGCYYDFIARNSRVQREL